MKNSFEEINKLWEEFKNHPFPSELHDNKYSDLELELTDTFVAGCISTFISNKGTLENKKVQILKQFKSDYGKIDERLATSTNNDYFKRLNELATLVLDNILKVSSNIVNQPPHKR